MHCHSATPTYIIFLLTFTLPYLTLSLYPLLILPLGVVVIQEQEREQRIV